MASLHSKTLVTVNWFTLQYKPGVIIDLGKELSPPSFLRKRATERKVKKERCQSLTKPSGDKALGAVGEPCSVKHLSKSLAVGVVIIVGGGGAISSPNMSSLVVKRLIIFLRKGRGKSRTEEMVESLTVVSIQNCAEPSFQTKKKATE